MDAPDALPPPADPVDAAAYWFARDHGGLMTAGERLRFEAWLHADPAHAQAYREMQETWGIARATPDHALRFLLRPPQAPRPARRRLAWALGAAACAAVVACVIVPGAAPVLFEDRYATARGELRTVLLPDQSRITLNTATQARVRYTATERHVVMDTGEIMFEVAPDAAKPFIVETQAGSVRVTGTRFDVRFEDGVLAVAVESGSVELRTGPWWNRQRAALVRGQGLRVSGRDEPLHVDAMDVSSLTAWRQGKAVFTDTPLEAVAREMNRYREHPIRVAGALRGLRIAGVFDVADTSAFLRVLPTLAPLRVVPQADGSVDLVAR
ncbi:FecR family protein [Achromobacter aloeverae]|uniref:Iron dicitrate transport regulator FecR n=1 Tax=Achromobacter aloeverae TaxID=1750518 RepID=A0A4Q1HHY4_9BURK|nr:FecR domain-containing protein [Achromobacter aloeverae]RXN87832.1 iron dicitrate transport regulator FecR [Achromobacter aloeverae]